VSHTSNSAGLSGARNRGKLSRSAEAKQQQSVRSHAEASTTDYSDAALLKLLKQIKASSDPKEIRRLTRSVERVIFHKQTMNA